MDLTLIENQKEFAKNDALYIDKIGLPKEVKDEIYRQENVYNKGMVAENERYNLALDLIHRFTETLL